MNTLQKSFQSILTQTGNDQGFNLDLLESTEFSECSEYYCKFINENKSIQINNSKKSLNIFNKFSTGDSFKSVLDKLDDEYYAIHRALNGNKVIVFIDKFLDSNAYCEFHFKENKLIFAKVIIDDKKSKPKFKKHILNETHIQNTESEKFILEDLKSNKLYVSLNGSTKLVFFDESELCKHLDKNNNKVV